MYDDAREGCVGNVKEDCWQSVDGEEDYEGGDDAAEG